MGWDAWGSTEAILSRTAEGWVGDVLDTEPQVSSGRFLHGSLHSLGRSRHDVREESVSTARGLCCDAEPRMNDASQGPQATVRQWVFFLVLSLSPTTNLLLHQVDGVAIADACGVDKYHGKAPEFGIH